LNLNSTVYGIHYTGELCQDVVSRSIYYTTTELLGKVSYCCAVRGKGADSGLFIVVHESAVTFNVCAKNGCEFTLKTIFCHRGTPVFKVSN
jgi:hypothetical protein